MGHATVCDRILAKVADRLTEKHGCRGGNDTTMGDDNDPVARLALNDVVECSANSVGKLQSGLSVRKADVVILEIVKPIVNFRVELWNIPERNPFGTAKA